MTRVESISENIHSEYYNEECFTSNELHLSSLMAIESEKELQERKSNRRLEAFREIIFRCNKPIKFGFIFTLYGFFGILLSFISTISYTLIPVHNLIENPQYWYELPLQETFSLLPLYAAWYVLNCSNWLNVSYIKKMRYFFILWGVFVVGTFIGFSTGYAIWTYALHFRYPIPLNSYAVKGVQGIVVLVLLWFLFPREWRKNNEFRKRLKYLILTMGVTVDISLVYIGLSKIFLALPTDYQWVIAIPLPLIREFNVWILTKLAKKSANGDMECVEITCAQIVGTEQAIYVTYMIGSLATTATSVALLATDFLINIYISIKIIWLVKKNQRKDITKISGLLQELVVNEFVECMVPMAYLLCLVIAYFGPNAELIGNVSNSYWAFTAIDDIENTILVIVIYFLVDFLSTIVNYILLQSWCRINLMNAYITMIKEFGFVFAINLATLMNLVRQYNEI